MKIEREKYLNLDGIKLENEFLRVYLLPELGFKIASIFYKKKDKEILKQAKDGEYKIPEFRDRFEDFDESGLDDIIPTMEEDEYPDGPYEGLELPDRGDVWSRSWEVTIGEDYVEGEILLKSLPLKFTRRVSLVENKLVLDYKVENLVSNKVKYMWSMQGLNYCDDDTRLILQDDMDKLVNVYSHEDLYSFDYKNIGEYKGARVYKYFIWGEFQKGLIGLDYTRDRFKYLIRYDVEKQPHLGIKVDKDRNLCTLETSNSFFDSISVATNNHEIWEIDGNDQDEWTIELILEDY